MNISVHYGPSLTGTRISRYYWFISLDDLLGGASLVLPVPAMHAQLAIWVSDGLRADGDVDS